MLTLTKTRVENHSVVHAEANGWNIGILEYGKKGFRDQNGKSHNQTVFSHKSSGFYQSDLPLATIAWRTMAFGGDTVRNEEVERSMAKCPKKDVLLPFVHTCLKALDRLERPGRPDEVGEGAMVQVPSAVTREPERRWCLERLQDLSALKERGDDSEGNKLFFVPRSSFLQLRRVVCDAVSPGSWESISNWEKKHLNWFLLREEIQQHIIDTLENKDINGLHFCSFEVSDFKKAAGVDDVKKLVTLRDDLLSCFSQIEDEMFLKSQCGSICQARPGQKRHQLVPFPGPVNISYDKVDFNFQSVHWAFRSRDCLGFRSHSEFHDEHHSRIDETRLKAIGVKPWMCRHCHRTFGLPLS